jgi:predicted Zn-dependent protease
VAHAATTTGGDVSVNLLSGRYLTVAVARSTRARSADDEQDRARLIARVAYAAYDRRAAVDTVTVTFPTVTHALFILSSTRVGERDRFRFRASDLVETRGRDQAMPPPPEAISLYLLPIDEVWPDLMARIAARLRVRFPIEVAVLPGLPLDPAAYDDNRDQAIADTLIADIQQRHAALLRQPGARIVAVTPDDMYLRTEDWAFAYSLRAADDRVAVVSYARMGPEFFGNTPDERLLESRVRKMVTKNVGVMCYGFPLSKDPRSVLYGSIGGADELDLMTEEFSPSN